MEIEATVICPSCKVIAYTVERRPTAQEGHMANVRTNDTGLSEDGKTCKDCGVNLERK